MKKHALMISTAALALAMSGGLVAAQGTGGASRGGEAPAASGSASGGAGMSAPRGGADTGATTGGAVEPRGGDASGGMRAQDNTGTKTNPREAQDNKAGQMSNPRSASETKGDMKGNKAANDTEHGNKNNTAADSKNGAEGKTTGNAATSAKAAPPAEKRTQITSAIKQENVKAVTNVNFNVSVGTRIPASVHFYPVPVSVVTIYPEWRGYEFILVGTRYIVVEPGTHEIVYILDV